ncbi:MAG: heavy-metal-associated domain-containing protein [Saprospirales bacterium]|nr:MAG: heavy-metal-associated domain-containing protein [Saprospirales bacterium]
MKWSLLLLASLMFIALNACGSECHDSEEKTESLEQGQGELELKQEDFEGVSLEIGVLEMGCNMCRGKVERTLTGLPGMKDVEVSLEDEKASFVYNPEVIHPDSIAAAVTRAGYVVIMP